MYISYQNELGGILSHKDEYKNLESTKNALRRVSHEIKNNKLNVRNNIVHSSPIITDAPKWTEAFLEEGDKLLQSSIEIVKKFEEDNQSNVIDNSSKLANVVDEITEASLLLQLAHRFTTIDELFHIIDQSNITKEYSLCIRSLQNLHDLINVDRQCRLDRIFQNCECYSSIYTKYQVLYHIAKQNLRQKFEQLLQLTEKTFHSSKSVIIRISPDDSQLCETMRLLFETNYNYEEVSDFLMKNCLEPIIVKPTAIETLTGKDEYLELRISYSLKDVNNKLRPSYKQVLQNIKLLFTALSKVNYKIDSQYFFSLLGEKINLQFLPMLIKENLMLAIPETLEEYRDSTLLNDFKDFENFLASNYILKKVPIYLKEFRENFHFNFKNRFIKNMLAILGEIMLKDLQDMTEINYIDEHEKERCSKYYVSKSVLEFTKVLEHIIHQPLLPKLNENENFQIETICLLLNTYGNEVPIIHLKLFESIPQQAALFYNNCLYLSFWINHNVQEKNYSIENALKDIETAGKGCFETQLSTQRKIIIDILEKFEISNDITLDEKQIKLVRQSMRQLDILKNVWHNVLAEDVYNVSFCNILNDVCRELTKRIISVEDISASLASDLSNLIDIVLEKAPKLFTDETMLVHVQYWKKLEQLKTILNATLQEILNLWCDGAGPLTLNYKAEEIKFLVRALFQNTDRRANVLSQIY